jgi:hypothetical protein
MKMTEPCKRTNHFQNGFFTLFCSFDRSPKPEVLAENLEVRSFFRGCLGSGLRRGTPVNCEYMDGADIWLLASLIDL